MYVFYLLIFFNQQTRLCPTLPTLGNRPQSAPPIFFITVSLNAETLCTDRDFQDTGNRMSRFFLRLSALMRARLAPLAVFMALFPTKGHALRLYQVMPTASRSLGWSVSSCCCCFFLLACLVSLLPVSCSRVPV